MMNHKRKQTSYYRGYSTYYDYETEKWYYEDNDKYIKSENRPCARCGKTPTLSGADYCLKDLEVCDFINAACCGHGERIGYISLQDGRIFREIDSSDILFKMFRLEDENKKLKEENDQLRQMIKDNVFGRYAEGSFVDLEFKAIAYDDIVKLGISNESEPKVLVVCKRGKKENVQSFCQMFIPFGIAYEIVEMIDDE